MKRLCLYCGLMAAVLFSLFISCSRDMEPTGHSPAPEGWESLSIEDAIALFSEYRESFSLRATVPTRSATMDVGCLNWDYARYANLLGFDIVEVPVEGFQAAYFTEGTEPDQMPDQVHPDDFPANSSVRLIAGIDGWGEPYFRSLAIWPARAFLEEVGKDARELTVYDVGDNYTGQLMLYDPYGEFTLGYIISGGTLIAMMHPADYEPELWEEEGTPKTRAAGCTPVSIWGWVEADCRPGSEIPCSRLVWTEMDMVTCPDGGGTGGVGTPNPGGGWGNGGGSSSGDDNNNNNNNNNRDGEEGEKCIHCKKYPCECATCPVCGEKEPSCKCCDVCHGYPCTCPISTDPCDNLAKKLSDPAFQSAIASLRSYTGSSVNREYGYTFARNPDGTYDVSALIYGENSGTEILFGKGNQAWWDGAVHSHHPGCGNMFSFGDLSIIYSSAYARKADINTFIYGLVSPTGTYFLMVEDEVAYRLFVDINFNHDPILGVSLTDAGYRNETTYNMGAYNYIEDCLKFLSEKQTGLTLDLH